MDLMMPIQTIEWTYSTTQILKAHKHTQPTMMTAPRRRSNRMRLYSKTTCGIEKCLSFESSGNISGIGTRTKRIPETEAVLEKEVGPGIKERERSGKRNWDTWRKTIHCTIISLC
jgi:hypothetical protein